MSQGPLRRTEWGFLAGLLGLCLLCFLTQEVNPFPHDGWFASQYRLFERQPGGDNFTPVAAPALLYGVIHLVGRAAGLGLEAEMILGALAHQLMLAMAGAALFLAHRRLGFRWTGAAASLLTVLLVQSTITPQAFWSENTTLLLATLVLWWSVESAAGTRRPGLLAVGLGLAIGLATITRATPIVLLPGVIWLGWSALPAPVRGRFVATATSIVAAIVLLQMAANHWRYGRFELSHSTGLHLWDGISFISDRVLEHSPQYQQLKAQKPDLQGCWWWELPRPTDEEPWVAKLEDAVRPMVLDGIRRHPLLFLREGIRYAVRALPRIPNQLGRERADYYNPLGRETLLAAPGGRVEWVPSALGLFLEVARWVYPLTLAVGLFGGFLGWRAADPTLRKIWLFAAWSLLSVVYLSNQIEKPDPRFALPYVGYTALLASIGIRIACQRGLKAPVTKS